MKRLYFLTLLTFIPFSSWSCFSSSSQDISVDGDTLNVIQTATFCLGNNATCPGLINYDFTIVNGEVIINAYYDLTGAWPQNGCESKDTIREFIPIGTYEVIFNTHIEGIDSNYLAESDTTSFVTVGLNQLEPLDDQLLLFPNPSSGKVSLTIKEWGQVTRTIQISDASGRIVWSKNCDQSMVNNNELELDLHFLDECIYYFHWISDQGRLTKTIVISH